MGWPTITCYSWSSGAGHSHVNYKTQLYTLSSKNMSCKCLFIHILKFLGFHRQKNPTKSPQGKMQLVSHSCRALHLCSVTSRFSPLLLVVWILLLFPFIIMEFLINSLNKWSILALKICHWYLCRFITKPPLKMKGKTTDNRVSDMLHIACHVWGDHSLEIHLLSVNPVRLYWLFLPSWYISAHEKSCSESPREEIFCPQTNALPIFCFITTGKRANVLFSLLQ